MMREWLARIAADIKRANRWLDPAWKPQPSWEPQIGWWSIATTIGNTYTWTGTR